MSVLIVGSIALDTVKTPVEEHADLLGGGQPTLKPFNRGRYACGFQVSTGGRAQNPLGSGLAGLGRLSACRRGRSVNRPIQVVILSGTGTSREVPRRVEGPLHLTPHYLAVWSWESMTRVTDVL